MNQKLTIMKAKKSKKADLRNKGGLFLEVGMVVALGIVLAAFQITTKDRMENVDLTGELKLDFEEEWLPINTEQKKQEPEPKPQVVEVLEIVEDIEDIPDIFIGDTEADMDTRIEIIAMDVEEIDYTEPETFVIVEKMPEYPGGNIALIRDIMSRVIYPEIAKENGIADKVYVEFVVNSKGKVDQVKISRGIYPSLNREAIRVIKSLTGWKPGRQRGKAVNVRFTVPINFKLN